MNNTKLGQQKSPTKHSNGKPENEFNRKVQIARMFLRLFTIISWTRVRHWIRGHGCANKEKQQIWQILMVQVKSKSTQ